MAVLLNEYKKIQFLVDSLVLPFIKNNHPKWRELISSYLEYLDNNSLFKSMNVTDNVDANEMYTELLDDFLKLYFKDVIDLNKFGLNDDNKRLFISLSKLIGNLKSTKTSFGFFFNSFSDFSIPSDSGDINVDDLTIELNEKPEWWLLNNSSTRPFTYVFKIDTPELANLKELIKRVHPAGWLQLFLFEIAFHDESGLGEYMNGHDCFELDIRYGVHYNGKWNYDGMMDVLGDPMPMYYNGGYTLTDDINCAPIPRFFGSSPSSIFDLTSAFGSEWFSPIALPDAYFGANQNGIAISNDDDLYSHETISKTLYKMDGLTSRVVASIGYPVGYESGWTLASITWNRVTDRLCLILRESKGNEHWVELSGFTTTIALDITLEHIPSGTSLENVRSLQLDADRNLLVGQAVGYSGQYHNYLVTYNYPSGTLYQGGWHGKLLSYTNSMSFSIIEPEKSSIHVINPYADDRDLREYDYLGVVGTGYAPYKGGIDFTVRTLGEQGIQLDPYGDMWMLGSESSSPYEPLLRRYHAISDELFPGKIRDFASKASPAYLNHPEVPSIDSVITDPALNKGEQSAAGELTFIMADDQGDDYEAVWGDGNFIYAAGGGAGLRSYSVDGAGDLTHLNTHDLGGDYRDVFGGLGPIGAIPVNLLGVGWTDEIFIDSNVVDSTFTVPGGTNRAVIVYLSCRTDVAGSTAEAEVYLGGKQLTKIFDENVDERTFRTMYLWVGYLLESDIALMANDDFTVTWLVGGPDQGTRFGFTAYENVDQNTPISDFNKNSVISATTLLTNSFSYEIGDQPIIVAAGGRIDGSFIDASEYTYSNIGGQDYGFLDAGGTVGWCGFLYSKEYLNDADTDNKTVEWQDACGIIAGGFVLNHVDAQQNFVYAVDDGSFGNGLISYTVDGGGNLTFKDNDLQGTDGYRGVFADANFIYVACMSEGLRTYSIDSSGILTHIDSDFAPGNDYYKVWGDGNFIYVACDLSGLRSYSVDGAGNLTHIDQDFQGSAGYLNVWGDGNFIYVATYDEGIRSYSVDGAGNLTFIDVDNQGGNYYGVWGDENFIYAACRFDGIRSYSVDGSGILTHIDTDKQDFGGYLDVWGDGNFIYTSCDYDGLRSYSVIAPVDWSQFTGDDFTGNDGDNINSDYWHLIDNGSDDDARIQSNKLYFDINNQIAYYGSNFKLTGDFDIQLDWEYVSAYNYSGIRLGIGTVPDPALMTDGAWISSDQKATPKFSGDIKMSGAWEGAIEDTRDEDYGQIRIARTGSTLRMYTKNGVDAYFLLRQRILFSTDDMYISIAGNTSTGNGCTFTIDNFDITGTVIAG